MAAKLGAKFLLKCCKTMFLKRKARKAVKGTINRIGKKHLTIRTKTVGPGLVEYMEWMKNLSLFHQMREKAEENRSKEKLDDYKMQIVRSLMQKNKMLEEIEGKLTKVENGDDPVQEKLIEKIQTLEKAVTNRAMLKKEIGQSEGKLNQMLDYMMYNMSTLQQMVQNVAQMQRMQYQHSQETNRVIQSLPQILKNANYQSGADISSRKRDTKVKPKPSQSPDGSNDESPKRKLIGKKKKSIDISKISSIHGDGKLKKPDPKSTDQKGSRGDGHKKTQTFGKLPSPKSPKDSINSDDEVIMDDVGKNPGNRLHVPGKQNTLGNSNKVSGQTPGKSDQKQPATGPLLNRGRSGMTGNTKSQPNNPQADGASVYRQDTPIKIEEGEEEQSSKQAQTIKTDSINLDQRGSQLNKTMHKDDSVALSEGVGHQNVSHNTKKNPDRKSVRRNTEPGENKNDITVLQMLASEKNNSQDPQPYPGGQAKPGNEPILSGLSSPKPIPNTQPPVAGKPVT
jgi:hypothetical protein